MSVPAVGLVQTRAEGRVELAGIAPIIEVCDALAPQPLPVLIFHDWERLTGYATEARVRLVAWSKSHPSPPQRVHILVGSKLVAMGVSVASLILPVLVTYNSRNAFERERLATIAERRRQRPSA